jgi:hypothetical protein
MPSKPLVSRPIRNHQAGIVQREDEAWRIALRRDVAAAIPIRGGDQHHGRSGDEGACVLIERRPFLEHRPRARGAGECPQLLLALDDMLERVHRPFS